MAKEEESAGRRAANRMKEAVDKGKGLSDMVDGLMRPYVGKSGDDEVTKLVNELYSSETKADSYLRALPNYVPGEDSTKPVESLIAEYGLNEQQLRDVVTRNLRDGKITSETVEALKGAIRNRLEGKYIEPIAHLVTAATDKNKVGTLADIVGEIDPESKGHVEADIKTLTHDQPQLVDAEAGNVLSQALQLHKARAEQKLYKGTQPVGYSYDKAA